MSAREDAVHVPFGCTKPEWHPVMCKCGRNGQPRADHVRQAAVRVAAEADDAHLVWRPEPRVQRPAYWDCACGYRATSSDDRKAHRLGAVVDALFEAGWRRAEGEPQRWIVGIGGRVLAAETQEEP